MTLQTLKLSPSRTAALEGSVTEKLEFNRLTCGSGAMQLPTADERRAAADQMRYQLYILDRSQRRLSIEDCVSALLESASAKTAD